MKLMNRGAFKITIRKRGGD